MINPPAIACPTGPSRARGPAAYDGRPACRLMGPSRARGPAGFALIATLLVLTAVSLLCVALFTMMRFEVATVGAHDRQFRADLAVESGLNDAVAKLSAAITTDAAIVFERTDLEPGQTGTGKRFLYAAVPKMATSGQDPSKAEETWLLHPLFSVPPAQSTPGGIKTQAPEFTEAKPPADLNSAAKEGVRVPAWQDPATVPVQWVESANSGLNSPDIKIRYTWWIEDMQGLLDNNHAGGIPKTTGDKSEEIATWTVFDPKAPKDQISDDDILATHRKLPSGETVAAAAFPSNGAADITKRKTVKELFIAGFPQTTPPDIIPFGFSYKDAGKRKFNLNDLAGNSNVDELTSAISTNLPAFVKRKGGFPDGEDYLKTLSASIIDYVDADTLPTSGAGYRGTDSSPFVNEMFDRYVRMPKSTKDPNAVNIQVRTFVELWNPSNKKISGSVSLRNENYHKITAAGTKTFSPVDFDTKNITMEPNEFVVLEFTLKPGSQAMQDFMKPGEELYATYQFNKGGSSPVADPLTFIETTNSSYRLSWNGKEVDWARGGVQRTEGTLRTGESQRKWKGHSSPALDTRIYQVGDPRQSRYIQTWIYANNYDKNCSWWGRCLKRDISNTSYNEVSLPAWGDAGRNSTPGTSSSSDATIPTTIPAIPDQPLLAPAAISNAGRYFNAAELGNIYDPIQWDSLDTGSANGHSGGGTSLAIGRPEFKIVDNAGMRASQLLDIFSGQNSGERRAGSLVNINTAPKEVLRALLAGPYASDPASPVFRAPDARTGSDEAGAMADAIINARRKQPFLAHSQVSSLKVPISQGFGSPTTPPGPVPVFGSPFAWNAAANPRPDGSWDDEGREGMYRQIHNNITMGSRRFRIIVCGELIKVGSSNGAPLVIAKACRMAHVSIEPATDTAGNPTPDTPPKSTIIYQRNLP